jgi:hypothetical protein
LKKYYAGVFHHDVQGDAMAATVADFLLQRLHA